GAEEARAGLAGMVGEGRLALGQHRLAKVLLAEAVSGLGPGRARSKALLMVRLAEAHRRLGDQREAARTAALARSLAAGMQSERLAKALREFDAAGRTAAR
ncbi:hypothetical protein BU198_20185, partial [Streptomyces sp. CBMA156]|nr:hypothetical protein [Streptomyces sp. CBMA156]